VGWGLEGRKWRLGVLCSEDQLPGRSTAHFSRRERARNGAPGLEGDTSGHGCGRYVRATGPFDFAQGGHANAPVPTLTFWPPSLLPTGYWARQDSGERASRVRGVFRGARPTSV
jgi:hypothetical protein